MPKLYEGNVPKKADFYSSCADWELYKTNEHHNGFMNFKLVSKKPRTHKANFWLGFNVKNATFVNNKDFKVLKKFFPEVQAWLNKTVREESDET